MVDFAKTTQASYEVDQGFSKVDAALRTFRANWASQASLIILDNVDPATAKDVVVTGITALKAQIAALETLLNDMADSVMGTVPPAEEPTPEAA